MVDSQLYYCFFPIFSPTYHEEVLKVPQDVICECPILMMSLDLIMGPKVMGPKINSMMVLSSQLIAPTGRSCDFFFFKC